MRATASPFQKAFYLNVQQEFYNILAFKLDAPSGNGVFDVGDGAYAPSRAILTPYAEGPAGSVFTMRLYGWRAVGQPVAVGRQLWLWNILAEFLCVAGELPGPRITRKEVVQNQLTALENICDGITLLRGVLGLNGWTNSGVPGNGCPASAAVELFGCRYISFDFAQAGPPNSGAIGMNCLWAVL